MQSNDLWVYIIILKIIITLYIYIMYMNSHLYIDIYIYIINEWYHFSVKLNELTGYQRR